LAQIEESVARYLQQLDSADRQEPSEGRHDQDGPAEGEDRQAEAGDAAAPEPRPLVAIERESGSVSETCWSGLPLSSRRGRLHLSHEVTNVGTDRAQLAHMAHQAKATLERSTLDVIARIIRRSRAIKARMGATHFLMRTLPRVASEMALHVLAYNLTRLMNIMGIQPLMAAIRA
jgi:hypothetical protein